MKKESLINRPERIPTPKEQEYVNSVNEFFRVDTTKKVVFVPNNVHKNHIAQFSLALKKLKNRFKYQVIYVFDVSSLTEDRKLNYLVNQVNNLTDILAVCKQENENFYKLKLFYYQSLLPVTYESITS